MKNQPRILRVLIVVLIIVLILATLFLVAAIIPSKITFEPFREYQTMFVNLSEKNLMNTSFNSAYSDLERIDVLFKNPNLESRDELVISLKTSSGEEIVTKHFSGFNFGDTSHARVDVPMSLVKSGDEVRVEVKLTQFVDGKLMVGTKNNEINLIQYYDSNTIRAIGTRFAKIITKVIDQPLVVLLPLVFGIATIW